MCSFLHRYYQINIYVINRFVNFSNAPLQSVQSHIYAITMHIYYVFRCVL